MEERGGEEKGERGEEKMESGVESGGVAHAVQVKCGATRQFIELCFEGDRS